MGKKTKRITVFQYIGSYENGFKILYTPVIPTNPHINCKQIKSYLKGDDLEYLSELLSDDFIYRDLLKKSIWENPAAEPEGDKSKHTLKEEYEYYRVRPFLEALFYEHQELFYQLVSDIIESKNPEIYEIFIKHFEQTDIPKTSLAPWKEATVKNIKKGIIDIEHYGQKLVKDHSVKGFHAMALSKNLSLLVLKAPEEKENINKAKMEWLYFKLKFLHELHNKDEMFAGHRGWKRIIANIASFIFSGCLLNGLNYCFTGNWWFRPETKTESKINKIHKMVNNDSAMTYQIKKI